MTCFINLVYLYQIKTLVVIKTVRGVTTFAFHPLSKYQVVVSERLPTPDPIDRREHRNARRANRCGEMHRTSVITKVKVAMLQSGSGLADI